MSERKNVLWLNHFVPYPAKGGLLIRTHGLLKSVVEEHDVTLFCLVQPRLLTPYFESIEKGLCEAKEYYENLGVNINFFELPSEQSSLKRKLTALKALFLKAPYSVCWLKSKPFKIAVNALLENKSFDYIHIDTMGLLNAMNIENNAQKIVINHHNAEHTMMSRRASKEHNIFKKAYFYLEAKKIAKYDAKKMELLKHHIVCSDDDGKEIQNLGTEINTITVPNGIEVTKLKTREPIKGNLLFIGGLDWYPNKDAMLYLLNTVCPILSKENLSVKIDIIGKNPSPEIIEAASKFHFVELHGFVDDINEFYSKAQAFICPLRDGGGTKLKVLDAMNFGLPVIGSDIAFEGIEIKDNVSGIRANNVEEIVNAVSEALKSPDLYKLVGEQARFLVENKYNAHKISKQYSTNIKNHAISKR